MQRSPQRSRQGVTQHELRRTTGFILVRGIDQHHAGDFLRIKSVVDSRVESAKRVPRVHIGWRHLSATKHRVQIMSDRFARSRIRTRIAPTFSGAIEPANLCERRELRLNVGPTVSRLTSAGVQNYRWRSVTSA